MSSKPVHQVIREALAAAGSAWVSVTFLKKDGTERQFVFNPLDRNEIKGTGSACSDPNIFRVREVHNKEEGKTTWRSFDARRVIKLKTKKEEISFTPEA